MIAVAKDRYKIEERDLYMKELSHTKEAFITGTTKKVMPVYQIDDIVIGNGKPGTITMNLQKLYDQYVSNYILEHA